MEDTFFNPFKDREVTLGEQVEVYRNLHVPNGYSIRSVKSKLVLAHCSTVSLMDCKFFVSESGRQATIQTKQKRIHAYVRGTLVGINHLYPLQMESAIVYNPYTTRRFTDITTGEERETVEWLHLQGKLGYTQIHA